MSEDEKSGKPTEPTDVDPVAAEENAVEEAVVEGGAVEDAAAPSSGRRDPLRIALAAIAGVLVLALAGGVGWLYWGHRQDVATEQARVDAVQAAGDQAKAMLSYDYNKVDEQLAAAADGLTGSFKDDYTKLVQETIAPGAKEKKLTVQVTVQAGAPVSATPDDAVVLLYLNQITTSSDAPEAATTGSRVRMEMHKDGDRWLTARLTPV
ncbi:h domain protein [Rhodococcus sp. NPDC127528]|uniref:h domain protein n=1 Tax=unclassified Rhodococcus (in: high G+C Gram-positive bacteria) TaxID=192944 RepID=UPI00362B9F7D